MTFEEAKAEYLNGTYQLSKEFSILDGERSGLLTNCEKYAGWTLPSLFTEENVDSNTELQHDFQSVGAEAVTNLANKMMMALFQPSRPFFRMNLTEEQKAVVMAASGVDPEELVKLVAKAERAATETLSSKKGRVSMTRLITLLMVTGNGLLHTPKGEDLLVYNLRDYVVTRNLRGDMNKLIIKETKAVRGLSDKLKALCTANGKDESKKVSLYTCAMRISDDKFMVWQELENFAYAHKQVGLFSEGNLPWIAATWDLARSQDYGNGLVENYAGDFHALSSFSEMILDFGAASTDVKNLVNPAGMTDVEEISEAASGAYVNGTEGDIFCYTPDLRAQVDFITNQIDKIERRIGRAFLMSGVVTRDAERVTAEEIRQQAQELEGSLGGVYSRIAVDIQQPLAKYLMAEEDEFFKQVEPVIVTGLESLSRMSDVDRMDAMLMSLAKLAELPERLAERLKYSGIVNRYAAGFGVDTEGILATEEEIQAERKRKAEEAANLAGQEAGAVAQATG